MSPSTKIFVIHPRTQKRIGVNSKAYERLQKYYNTNPDHSFGELKQEYIISPLTNKIIKVGSRAYQSLQRDYVYNTSTDEYVEKPFSKLSYFEKPAKKLSKKVKSKDRQIVPIPQWILNQKPRLRLKSVKVGSSDYKKLMKFAVYDKVNNTLVPRKTTAEIAHEQRRKARYGKFNHQVQMGKFSDYIDAKRMGKSLLYYHVNSTQEGTTSKKYLESSKQNYEQTHFKKQFTLTMKNNVPQIRFDSSVDILQPLSPFDKKQLSTLINIFKRYLSQLTESTPSHSKCLMDISAIEMCVNDLDSSKVETVTRYLRDSRLPNDRILITSKEDIFINRYFEFFMEQFSKELDYTRDRSGLRFVGILGFQINLTPIKNSIGSYIPTPIEIVGDTLLNIKADDNKCLQRCLIYATNQSIIDRSRRRYQAQPYNKFWKQSDKFTVNGVSIHEIEQQLNLVNDQCFQATEDNFALLEKLIHCRINVYQIDILPNDYSAKKVYPLQPQKYSEILPFDINLCILSIPDKNINHFTVITNVQHFRNKMNNETNDKNGHNNRMKKCPHCEFSHTDTSIINTHKFVYHPELMENHEKYILPRHDERLAFDKTRYTMKLPVVVYADFESCISKDTNQHKPIMCSVVVISNLPAIKSQYKCFFAEHEDPVDFVPMIEYLASIRKAMVDELMENTQLKMTEADTTAYNATKNCPFCHRFITDDPLLREYLETKNSVDKLDMCANDYEFLEEMFEVESELMIDIELGKIRTIEDLRANETEKSFIASCSNPEVLLTHKANCLHEILCHKYQVNSMDDLSVKVRHHAHFDAEYSNGQQSRVYNAGEFICACCTQCNVQLKYTNKGHKTVQIPIYFHNGSRYDNTFINIALGKYAANHNTNIEIIPVTIDKEMTIQCDGLCFKDSYRMVSAPLKNLVNQLLGKDKSKYKYTIEFMRDFFEHNHEPFDNSYIDLLLRKEPMFYNLVNSFDSLWNQSLPQINETYDQINQSIMPEEDYKHLKLLWDTFHIQSWGEYYTMYNLLDTTLLADAFEEFRSATMDKFTVDPAHFLTCSQMSYELFLKSISNHDTSRFIPQAEEWADYMLKIEENENMDRSALIKYYLDTMTTFHKKGGIGLMVRNSTFTKNEGTKNFALFQEQIRGGITQISTRYANVTSAESNKDSIYYLDANNLYGSVMMRPMPYEICNTVDPDTFDLATTSPEEFVRDLPTFSTLGYFILCDIEVPANKHDQFNDLPLFPTQNYGLLSKPLQDFAKNNNLDKQLGKNPNKTIEELFTNDPAKKLICNLLPKKNYLVHYSMLQLGLNLGYKITAIHKLIPFRQAPFIFEYINTLSKERANTDSAVLKNLYKLLANSIYGKFVESGLNRIKVKVATTYEQQQKIIAKHSYQLIQSAELYSENLWFAKIYKPQHDIRKPLYIGNAILDMSKYWIYKFYYDRMKNAFDSVQLLAQDTDSLIVRVKSEDNNQQIANLWRYFDFSEIDPTSDLYKTLEDYFKNNNLSNRFESFSHFLNYNKEVPGPFKDEHNGRRVLEFVGLRPKLYSLIDSSNVVHNAGKGVPRVINYNGNRVCVGKTNNMTLYKQVLFPSTPEEAIVKGKFSRISNRKMNINTIEQEKVCFSALDNKRYVCEDNINTFAFGHYKIPYIETEKYCQLNNLE